jgi:predicted RNA binding protein YcfA (HicA-like mRNA interferase family)
MGQKKYPPINPSEVESILRKLGFTFDRQEGDHAQWERNPTPIDPQRRIVTVDRGCRDFDDTLIKSMISQSGETREAFYGATKRTAAKAGVRFVKSPKSAEPLGLNAEPEPEGD